MPETPANRAPLAAESPPFMGFATPELRPRQRRYTDIESPPVYGWGTPARKDNKRLQRLIDAEEGHSRPQRKKRAPVRLGLQEENV